ncbi:MAG TPA: hypothetical protein PLX03_06045 [Candidatus Hydrogenedentes bacterium]|nr:hypothetical protein [Candidatus Hydrogenedentota bacterium]
MGYTAACARPEHPAISEENCSPEAIGLLAPPLPENHPDYVMWQSCFVLFAGNGTSLSVRTIQAAGLASLMLMLRKLETRILAGLDASDAPMPPASLLAQIIRMYREADRMLKGLSPQADRKTAGTDASSETGQGSAGVLPSQSKISTGQISSMSDLPGQPLPSHSNPAAPSPAVKQMPSPGKRQEPVRQGISENADAADASPRRYQRERPPDKVSLSRKQDNAIPQDLAYRLKLARAERELRNMPLGPCRSAEDMIREVARRAVLCASVPG